MHEREAPKLRAAHTKHKAQITYSDTAVQLSAVSQHRCGVCRGRACIGLHAVSGAEIEDVCNDSDDQIAYDTVCWTCH